MALDIVTIGLACSDVLLKPMVRELFDRDAITLDSIMSHSGGDVVNTAIDCQKMGLEAGVVCKVGTDTFANPIWANLKDAGVNTQGVVEDPSVATSVSIVCIEPDGRHFAVNQEANNSLCYEDVDVNFIKIPAPRSSNTAALFPAPKMDEGHWQALRRVPGSRYAHLLRHVLRRRHGGGNKILEPMFQHLDIFLPSMYEVTALTGKQTCEEIEEFFRPYGLKMMAIKLGGDGCFVTDFKKHRYIRTFENAPGH